MIARAPRWIEHVTLNTGHVRRSTPDEVSDDAISACQSLIDECREFHWAVIPGIEPAYCLRLDERGRCAIATVHRVIDETLGRYGPTLVTIGIATHSRCGSNVWRCLHDRDLETSPDDCPPEPWCAARLEPEIVGDPAIDWLGDFERCLAWAWLGLTGERA